MGWGSAFRVFYCSSFILRRYDVCLLRRQCLISYYKTIIRPGLEYASPTWNPWMKTDIEKLEKVQRKCLNMCIEPVEMHTLQFRRNFADLVEI